MKQLIILCGASGTGKTTIQNYLQAKYQIPRVITHTTRKQRTGEVNGVDYYFETPSSFAKNHYFESVNYDGKKYGSSRKALDKAWEKHSIVSLVVDTEGAIEYVKQLKEQVTVLHIEVENFAVLKERLIERGDSTAAIEQRLASKESQRDLQIPASLQPYTTVAINGDWEQTKTQIGKIIQKIQLKIQ